MDALLEDLSFSSVSHVRLAQYSFWSSRVYYSNGTDVEQQAINLLQHPTLTRPPTWVESHPSTSSVDSGSKEVHLYYERLRPCYDPTFFKPDDTPFPARRLSEKGVLSLLKTRHGGPLASRKALYSIGIGQRREKSNPRAANRIEGELQPRQLPLPNLKRWNTWNLMFSIGTHPVYLVIPLRGHT